MIVSSLARRDRHDLALFVGDAREDADEAPALVAALLDAQRHLVLERGELADLDRRAERARAQLELKLLVVVARQRLQVADVGEVHHDQHQRHQVGHAQQPRIAEADGAHRIELARGGQLAEGEEHAQHQPQRNGEADIFGHHVRQHLEHDADRAARRRDEVEQLEHLVEHEQRRRDHEDREHRHQHEPEDVTVYGSEEFHVGRESVSLA
jgi:hypothetical protein